MSFIKEKELYALVEIRRGGERVLNLVVDLDAPDAEAELQTACESAQQLFRSLKPKPARGKSPVAAITR